MRALVVDDSPEVRARLVAMLHEIETIDAVDEAGCAEEALVTAGIHAPDAVILDINMPGKNGIAILPALRRLESAPLIIVLTNDPTEHHRRLCLASGANFFFDKSKHFDAVLDVLRGRALTAGA